MRGGLKSVSVSVDLGGTNMRVALVDQKGNILKKRQRLTNSHLGRDKVFDNLVGEITQGVEMASSAEYQLEGIGIGYPGLVDGSGVVRGSPQFPDWIDFPLLHKLKEKFDVHIYVENDANCAALGELWMFGEKLPDTFVFVTLGSGIGGGVVLKGKLWKGYQGAAGEVGHIPVNPSGPICGGGHRGCVEMFSSGVGLQNLFKQVSQSVESEFIKIFKEKESTLSPKCAFEWAKNDDIGAKRLYELFGNYLGIAFASIVNLLNPDAIVIGGAISNSWEFFSNHIRVALHRHCFSYTADSIQIIKARLGEDAGLIGAASLVFLKDAYYH